MIQRRFEISGRCLHGHESSGAVHRESGNRVVLLHVVVEEKDHVKGRRVQGDRFRRRPRIPRRCHGLIVTHKFFRRKRTIQLYCIKKTKNARNKLYSTKNFSD